MSDRLVVASKPGTSGRAEFPEACLSSLNCSSPERSLFHIRPRNYINRIHRVVGDKSLAKQFKRGSGVVKSQDLFGIPPIRSRRTGLPNFNVIEKVADFVIDR